VRKHATIASTHSTRLPLTVRTTSPLLIPRRLRLPASRALRSAIWPNVHVRRLLSRVSSMIAVRSLGAASTMSRAKFTVAHLRAAPVSLVPMFVPFVLRLCGRPRGVDGGDQPGGRRAHRAEAAALPIERARHDLVGVGDAEVAGAEVTGPVVQIGGAPGAAVVEHAG